MMKRTQKLVMFLLALMLSFAFDATMKVTAEAASEKDVVTLNVSEIKNWEVGKEGPFKAYVNGVQVDRTTMTWSSSNTTVATCVNGNLVGKSAGTTTITCTKTNGTTATCKVTVVGGKDVVTLNTNEIKNWEVGQSGPFKVYVNGVQVDRTTMTWNSSNPSVATCVNGKLVGKSAGTTTITCTKANGTTASCKVTVVSGKDVVTLNAAEIKNWEVGQSGAFKVYVNGVQVDRTTMTWSSSNTAVATCVNGKLVGKSAGTTTITCTKANGTTASCKVTVVRGKDVVTLNAAEIKNWEVGQEGPFKAYVNGVQVDRTTMTWNSSNPSVATCVNGKLVGKSAGTTTITCTKTNGTTASCKVTVVGGKDVVTLNAAEIKNWEVGQSGTFKVYVNGVQADRTTMTWSSSNTAVATCVNGRLVGKSAGTTTITCTKTNGTTATCKVTVVKGKDVVTLNTSEIKNWEVGQSGTFKVYVNGVQADRTTMTWSSSNTAVATCVNGRLVGKSAGTTTITCTKTNGTVASCTVTVKAAPTPGVTPIPDRNLGGIDLIIGDYWSPNTPAEPTNATEAAIKKYREELFAKYNFTMKSKAVADWGTMEATYIESVIRGEPAAQLFELNSSFISTPLTYGLFYDLATLEELDFSEAKWNQSVKNLMTKGNSVYGMQVGKGEPGVGLIWNKRLFEEAGIDPNLPYDLQASGKWTWSAFEDLCKKLTRDVDNDGVTDIYATCSQGSMTMTAFVVSGGSDFIVKDAKGNLVNNLNSDEVIDAINFAVDLYDKGYEMPQPEDSNWDYFVPAFQQGKAAMQFHEEYTCQPPYQYGDEMEDEIGFVLPPKPDGATKNYSYVNNNIVVIPSCYDEETAGKIAFAYNVYTMASAAYEGENYWKTEYYSHFSDTRAVDETIAKFFDGSTGKMLTKNLLPSSYLEMDLLWHYPFTHITPEEQIASITDSWNALLYEINQSY